MENLRRTETGKTDTGVGKRKYRQYKESPQRLQVMLHYFKRKTPGLSVRRGRNMAMITPRQGGVDSGFQHGKPHNRTHCDIEAFGLDVVAIQ